MGLVYGQVGIVCCYQLEVHNQYVKALLRVGYEKQH